MISDLLEKPGSPEEMLEHFGIKGMKWGVRKRYESSGVGKGINKVKSKNRARKEGNAKRHEANASEAQVAINKIKANPSKWRIVQRGRNNRVKELEQYRDRELKAAKDIRADKLTDFQKKVVIGAGITAAVVATYGTYKFIDSGSAHRLLTKSQPLKKNDLLSRSLSEDGILRNVVKPINPGYAEGQIGTKVNCRRCTMAYEMRRRGYDVKATNSIGGTGQHPTSILQATDARAKGRWGALYDYGKEARDRMENPNKALGPMEMFMEKAGGMGKNPISDNNFHTLTPAAKSITIFNALSKNPEGARGELGMGWNFGGAHSMAWEIIGGKPVIFDTQTGRSYNQTEFLEIAERMNRVASTRLDDAPLNTTFLRKWVRDVK